MKPSALVTGSHGFIGRYVARCFADAGYRVTGIGHGSWGREEWRSWGIADWHTADVSLDTLVTYAGKPDVIVHCAGSGSVGFSLTNPYQDFERNVLPALAVLEFARLFSPNSRVVIPSSAGVYGKVSCLPIPESADISPISPYSEHKWMIERLAGSYAANFGVAVAIVRLFSVYGDGLQKQLLWDACVKFAAGDTDFFGTGKEERDWLHVSDAARLLMVAAEHASSKCEVVNGGTGKGTAVVDVLARLSSQMGIALAPTFSRQSKPGDPDALIADISRATSWGWQAQKSLSEGLADYVRWFGKNN